MEVKRKKLGAVGGLPGEPVLAAGFRTVPKPTEAKIPPVRAKFYRNGSEVHVIDIAGGSEAIPVELDASRVSWPVASGIRRQMRVSQAMPCSPVGFPSRRARLILASVLLLVEENRSP